MATQKMPRQPRVDFLSVDGGPVVGILVSRATGDQAFDMALNALIVDLGWDATEALNTLRNSSATVARWRKVPDPDSGRRKWWRLYKCKEGKSIIGSMPGTYFSLPSWDSEEWQ